MYLNDGYKRYERSYKLKCQHKEYTILCPEFQKDKEGCLPVVLIPDFLVPRRPYPVYVYLYAIDLYSANPEKGQRWAAEETRKRFGLHSFAHTTLGRALKTLVRNLDTAVQAEGRKTEPSVNGEKIDSAVQNEIMEEYSKQSTNQTKGIAFPSVHSTEALRKRAACFLNGKLADVDRSQSIKVGQMLAWEWFKKYGQFLL